MSASRGSVAAGALLLIAGAWLLLQTLVGDLPSRLVGLAGTAKSAPSPSGGSKAVQSVGQVGGKAPTFNPKTGKAVPGTGIASGGGLGPGGTGYGTGSAPGYQPPGGLYST